MFRKEKRKYFQNINIKNITDNKLFWKTVKPLFSNKSTSHDKITLIENNEVISDNKEISEILNNFFSNIVMELDINENSNLLNEVDPEMDPLQKSTLKYQNHPSIVTIRSHINNNSTFSFTEITESHIRKEIQNLDTSKGTQKSDIPTKIIKDNIDIFSKYICLTFNKSIRDSNFPDILKPADITPVFKNLIARSKTITDL